MRYVMLMIAGLMVAGMGQAAVTSTGDVSPGQPIDWTASTNGYIGEVGSGTLSITAGDTVRDAKGFIGYGVGSTGSVTVADANSTWLNAGSLYVGLSGNGTLALVNGGRVSNDTGVLGYYSNSTSYAVVDGAGSVWANSGKFYVGNYGHGTLEIKNGGTVSNTVGHISYYAGSASSVTVDGANSLWDNSSDLAVGAHGDGTLSIVNGGIVRNSDGYIGFYADSMSSVTVEGAQSLWDNSGILYIGVSGAGTLSILDDALVLVSEVYIDSELVGTDSSINLASGGALGLLDPGWDTGSQDLNYFIGMIGGAASNSVNYWDGAGWENITNGTENVDYALTHYTSGELSGYTTVAAIPEPVVASLFILFGAGIIGMRRIFLV